MNKVSELRNSIIEEHAVEELYNAVDNVKRQLNSVLHMPHRHLLGNKLMRLKQIHKDLEDAHSEILETLRRKRDKVGDIYIPMRDAMEAFSDKPSKGIPATVRFDKPTSCATREEVPIEEAEKQTQ